MAEILHEQTVHNNHIVLVEGEIRSGGKTFTKVKVQREDAVGVLLVNTDTATVILTKQFRYPIAEKSSVDILEIVAGKVDEGEEPEQAALREVEEETGYRVKPVHLKFLFSCFVSPGYSSERFLLYYAQVTDQDKVAAGGGLQQENEKIEIVEMTVAQFNENLKKAAFKDAKTCIAGMFLLLHKVIP
jgi:nudix-type nucleoside diphosphatase (YffH/AdpP family)